MTWTYRHRKQILIAFLICGVLGSLGTFFLLRKTPQKDKKEEELVLSTSDEKEEEEKEEEKQDEFYLVDIKGEVNAPGTYSVKDGSRVIDVIRLAGDLTANADTSVINLSKKVEDEMVIIIYSQEEVANFVQTKEIEQQKQEECRQPQSSTIINDACIIEEAGENDTLGKISINTATKEELMTLNGIGEAKAEAIIKYRDEIGSFQSIEEIKEVSGIGEELFAQIKENITT